MCAGIRLVWLLRRGWYGVQERVDIMPGLWQQNTGQDT